MQFYGLISNTEIIVNICETVIFKIEFMRQMLNCETTSGNSLTKFENVEWRYFSLSVLAIQKLYFGVVY